MIKDMKKTYIAPITVLVEVKMESMMTNSIHKSEDEKTFDQADSRGGSDWSDDDEY